MRRAGQGPGDDVGDVVSHEGPFDARVDGLRPPRVAQAVERELLRFHKPGGDLDDSDRLAQELEAKGSGQHPFGVLGGHVAGSAGIDFEGRHRRHEDDVAARLPQVRQKPLCQPEGRQHVFLVHAEPGGGIAFGDRIDADGPARVVDEPGHRSSRSRVLDEAFDVGLVGQIGRVAIASRLARELPKAFLAPRRGEDVKPLGDEPANRRLADAGGRSRHDRPSPCRCISACHVSPFASKLVAACRVGPLSRTRQSQRPTSGFPAMRGVSHRPSGRLVMRLPLPGFHQTGRHGRG